MKYFLISALLAAGMGISAYGQGSNNGNNGNGGNSGNHSNNGKSASKEKNGNNVNQGVAPEIDPASGTMAIALLFGGVAVIRGRRN